MTVPPPPTAPSFIRPVLALLAGLGISVVIVVIGSIVAAIALLRGGDQVALQAAPAYLVATLVLSGVGGLVGGYAASRLTVDRSFYAVLLLAAVLLTSGLAQAMRRHADVSFPDWYTYGVAVLAPVGALLGGLLQRWRARPLDAPRTPVQH